VPREAGSDLIYETISSEAAGLRAKLLLPS
jgi:hypothetical protein